MKTLTMRMLVIVAATIFSTNLSATKPIVSSSLLIVEISNTFVEVKTNTFLDFTFLHFSPFYQQTKSMGEKKMKVKVDDNKTNNTATAEVEIYSLDGIDILGPYTVTEGNLLEVEIDNREWGVNTIESSADATVSYWSE